MTSTLGRRIKVGIARETTRLTLATDAVVWLPWTELSVNPINTVATDDSAVGIRAGLIDEKIATQYVEGSMKCVTTVENSGYLFALLYGSVASAQTATTGAYTHTASTYNTDANMPTFSLFYEKMRTSMTWKQVRGCMISSASVEAVIGDKVTISISFMGIEESIDASPSVPVYTASKMFVPENITFAYATTYAGLASSATSLCVQSVKFDYNNNVTMTQCLGSKFNSHIHANQVDQTVEFKSIIHLNELESAHLNGTDLALELKLEDLTAPNLGTSTLKPLIRLRTAPSRIDQSISTSINDLVESTYTSNIKQSFTDGLQSQMIWQNTIASY
jgi:hypothetical protein